MAIFPSIILDLFLKESQRRKISRNKYIFFFVLIFVFLDHHNLNVFKWRKKRIYQNCSTIQINAVLFFKLIWRSFFYSFHLRDICLNVYFSRLVDIVNDVCVFLHRNIYFHACKDCAKMNVFFFFGRAYRKQLILHTRFYGSSHILVYTKNFLFYFIFPIRRLNIFLFIFLYLYNCRIEDCTNESDTNRKKKI